MYRNNWSLDRKTYAYFPSFESRRSVDPKYAGYNHMFVEDVRNLIVPYGIEDKNKYSVKVEPDNDKNRELVCAIFSDDSYPRITHAVYEAIRKYASMLAWWKKTYYEIATVSLGTTTENNRNNKKHTPTQSFIRPLHIPGKVLSLGTKIVQIVPKADRAEFKRSFVVIPKESVWILSLPSELGGPRGLKKMQSSLAMSYEFLPQYVQRDSWLQDKDFIWKEFANKRVLLAMQATSKWGWTGRSMWDKDILEYYLLYRELHFAWSMAVLRNYILREMNNFLLRQNYNLEIKMTGLPNPNDVDKQIIAFEAGKLPFNKVLEFSRFREAT